MSFLDKALAKVKGATQDLGASVVKLFGYVGVHPTPAELDGVEAKSDAFAAAVAKAAEAYIDGLPGVPTVAAQLVSHAALTFIDGVIAGAIQGAKDVTAPK